MIELIPAIDIMDGKCVRLTKGDYTAKIVYDASPLDMAMMFEDLGFRRLHVVDLDGARSSHVVNANVLTGITNRTSLKVDFGGGVKSDDDIKEVFDRGASLVTVGSVAVTHKEMFLGWLTEYGHERLILGADARDGKISINGWKEYSEEDIASFLDFYTCKGVSNVLCTDISRDGTLTGPAFSLYTEILRRYPDINLIASGGVSSVADVCRLAADGVPSVILGKAIYEGKIDIRTIIEEVNNPS